MKVATAGILALALVAPALEAGVFEVPVKLPVKARLELQKGTPLALAPFVISTSAEDRAGRASRVDVMGEFARFAQRIIEKETDLKVILALEDRLPTTDLRELVANRDYWKQIASRAGADYVVSGSIDFDIEDKSRIPHRGVRLAGRRQDLLPAGSGREHRVRLRHCRRFVFDGETGEKLVEENYRDFKEFDERNYDELSGLFENLRAMDKISWGSSRAGDHVHALPVRVIVFTNRGRYGRESETTRGVRL
jgi:hypothetical protein